MAGGDRVSVTLHFDPAETDEDLEDVRGELSSVVQVGRDLFLGADEAAAIERLSPAGEGVFGHHRSFALGDFIDLPSGAADEEVDIEGLAESDGWLWVVGSHSLKRNKPDPAGDAAEEIEKLAGIERERNRFLLARIPIASGDDGAATLRARTDDGRAAARLALNKRGSKLTRALRDDPHLAPFLDLPGKDNGFDIEGIAASGDRLFLGLRGPVLRGLAIVLEVRVKQRKDGALKLRRIGADGQRYRKHFLDIAGLGVRELRLQGDDLLILAGPTMTLDGASRVVRWRGALGVAAESMVAGDALETVAELPYAQGEHHPEGMALLADGGMLIVYDSPRGEAMREKAGVRGDIYFI